jgi:hypothetical protein
VTDIGDVLPFAATVRNAAGVLADAGSTTITITRDGVPEPGSPFGPISSTTTGQYDKDYVAPAAGRYVGTWLMTGANAGTHVQVFDVGPADPGYILSLARAKRHLNIPAASTTSDEELSGWLAATTTIVEDIVGPVVVRTIVNERHNEGPVFWLRKRPVLIDAPGLAVFTVTPWLTTGTTYPVADVRVSADGRVERRVGYVFLGGPFAVTYQVGRRVIPANISGAAAIILKGLWETQRGASGSPLAAADELVSEPGMGLVMWRAKLLLAADDLGPSTA